MTFNPDDISVHDKFLKWVIQRKLGSGHQSKITDEVLLRVNKTMEEDDKTTAV